MLWSSLKMFYIKNNDEDKQHNIKARQCNDTASFFKPSNIILDIQRVVIRYFKTDVLQKGKQL